MLKEKSTKSSFEKLKFIDLFAGIGGFHLALSHFGVQCVFASEWDKAAAEIYEQNFKMKPAGDITLINEKEIPNHDILCAGFPCQAFSVSGKQLGFEDTRGTLFFDILRIVKYHLPKIVFLENVKNLIQHDKGYTMQIIVKALTELGYKVNYKVLNAKQFGLPQNRERVFIVCFRKDLKINKFKFPNSLYKPISLLDILEKEPVIKNIKRKDVKFNKEVEPIKDLYNNQYLPNKLIQIGIVNKGGQGERIYSPYGIACTLSAYGGGVGAKTGLYFVDGKIRRLTPRECARVQGFPDWFKIHKNSNEAYKQFGNSVPVNVLKAIMKEIEKVI